MEIVSENAIKPGFLSNLANISGKYQRDGRLFIKNKANFLRGQMNVKSSQAKDYDDFSVLRLPKNKANSNLS